MSVTSYRLLCIVQQPYDDDPSLFTMIPLKIGENTDWFAQWHQGF